MNDEEYVKTQQNLILFAQLITTMDLDGFLERISRAESVGPVVVPTLYLQARRKLENLKRLTLAAQTFQREAARQIGEEEGEL